jgi:hypothetical protein
VPLPARSPVISPVTCWTTRKTARPRSPAFRGRCKAAHSVAMRKHDAVAGADHGLGTKLIGEAKARPKVLPKFLTGVSQLQVPAPVPVKFRAPFRPVTGLARFGSKKLS